MRSDDIIGISKRLSHMLRHRPDTAGIELDSNGWVDVEALVLALNTTGDAVLLDQIEHVVGTSDKRRFELVDGRIRAAQGHSVSVDLGLAPLTPPEILFHGTVERFLPLIAEQGLRPMKRSHVHLSADDTTATNVGERRGAAVILQVRALRLNESGHDCERRLAHRRRPAELPGVSVVMSRKEGTTVSFMSDESPSSVDAAQARNEPPCGRHRPC